MLGCMTLLNNHKYMSFDDHRHSRHKCNIKETNPNLTFTVYLAMKVVLCFFLSSRNFIFFWYFDGNRPLRMKPIHMWNIEGKEVERVVQCEK